MGAPPAYDGDGRGDRQNGKRTQRQRTVLFLYMYLLRHHLAHEALLLEAEQVLLLVALADLNGGGGGGDGGLLVLGGAAAVGVKARLEGHLVVEVAAVLLLEVLNTSLGVLLVLISHVALELLAAGTLGVADVLLHVVGLAEVHGALLVELAAVLRQEGGGAVEEVLAVLGELHGEGEALVALHDHLANLLAALNILGVLDLLLLLLKVRGLEGLVALALLTLNLLAEAAGLLELLLDEVAGALGGLVDAHNAEGDAVVEAGVLALEGGGGVGGEGGAEAALGDGEREHLAGLGANGADAVADAELGGVVVSDAALHVDTGLEAGGDGDEVILLGVEESNAIEGGEGEGGGGLEVGLHEVGKEGTLEGSQVTVGVGGVSGGEGGGSLEGGEVLVDDGDIDGLLLADDAEENLRVGVGEGEALGGLSHDEGAGGHAGETEGGDEAHGGGLLLKEGRGGLSLAVVAVGGSAEGGDDGLGGERGAGLGAGEGELRAEGIGVEDPVLALEEDVGDDGEAAVGDVNVVNVAGNEGGVVGVGDHVVAVDALDSLLDQSVHDGDLLKGELDDLPLGKLNGGLEDGEAEGNDGAGAVLDGRLEGVGGADVAAGEEVLGEVAEGVGEAHEQGGELMANNELEHAGHGAEVGGLEVGAKGVAVLAEVEADEGGDGGGGASEANLDGGGGLGEDGGEEGGVGGGDLGLEAVLRHEVLEASKDVGGDIVEAARLLVGGDLLVGEHHLLELGDAVREDGDVDEEEDGDVEDGAPLACGLEVSAQRVDGDVDLLVLKVKGGLGDDGLGGGGVHVGGDGDGIREAGLGGLDDLRDRVGGGGDVVGGHL